ncbi:hypothetical protein NIES2107_01190 [Nostoc carneum NIES-2107]|nr:hypothetical protein NIES2107_01190 [Nostoc carneum NIES-2107]
MKKTDKYYEAMVQMLAFLYQFEKNATVGASLALENIIDVSQTQNWIP